MAQLYHSSVVPLMWLALVAAAATGISVAVWLPPVMRHCS